MTFDTAEIILMSQEHTKILSSNEHTKILSSNDNFDRCKRDILKIIIATQENSNYWWQYQILYSSNLYTVTNLPNILWI